MYGPSRLTVLSATDFPLDFAAFGRLSWRPRLAEAGGVARSAGIRLLARLHGPARDELQVQLAGDPATLRQLDVVDPAVLDPTADLAIRRPGELADLLVRVQLRRVDGRRFV